jgi:hypothetical protein
VGCAAVTMAALSCVSGSVPVTTGPTPGGRSRAGSAPRYPGYELVLLNLATGGTQGGDPSKTSFPARYEIDYVRVYQRSQTASTHWQPRFLTRTFDLR